MSAFNNNNTNLNNTSAGIEGRFSSNPVVSPNGGNGSPNHGGNGSPNPMNPNRNVSPAPYNNIESAYQREQLLQSADLKRGNNLNDTYNRFQPGQAGALNENHGIAATGLNQAQGVSIAGGANPSHNSGLNQTHGHHTSSGLNENHGLAATGLNEPHTHSTINSNRGNDNLNYSGAQIDSRKVDQQDNYGKTAGQDLNSTTNRTAGTGIPPVNTAEHVRRNRAEEEIAHGEHGHHTHGDHNDTNKHSHTASLGDHGASHHNKNNGGVGHENKTHEHDALGHNNAEKTSAGDKIKGNLEKVVGKLTGNEEKVIKGESLAQGRSI